MGLKLLPLILMFLTFATSNIFACGCGSGTSGEDPVSAEEAMANIVKISTAVFAGKVVGFEYRDNIVNKFAESIKLKDPTLTYKTKVVKIEVYRWWKLGTGPFVYLVTDETKLSDGSETRSCDYPFQIDENYVVFANGTKDELRAGMCGPTLSLKQQTEAPKALGPGKEPIISDPRR